MPGGLDYDLLLDDDDDDDDDDGDVMLQESRESQLTLQL